GMGGGGLVKGADGEGTTANLAVQAKQAKQAKQQRTPARTRRAVGRDMGLAAFLPDSARGTVATRRLLHPAAPTLPADPAAPAAPAAARRAHDTGLQGSPHGCSSVGQGASEREEAAPRRRRQRQDGGGKTAPTLVLSHELVASEDGQIATRVRRNRVRRNRRLATRRGASAWGLWLGWLGWLG